MRKLFLALAAVIGLTAADVAAGPIRKAVRQVVCVVTGVCRPQCQSEPVVQAQPPVRLNEFVPQYSQSVAQVGGQSTPPLFQSPLSSQCVNGSCFR